jgi:hypothetical protein
VVVYAFRQIKRREVNFLAHDLELTTIVFAFKKYKGIIYMELKNIFFYHKILKYLMSQEKLNIHQ